jgi:hypothetical protein
MKDPYSKTYHYAGAFGSDGSVSALCFVRPRAIDLSRTTWTITPSAVTCKKCKAKMKERNEPAKKS